MQIIINACTIFQHFTTDQKKKNLSTFNGSNKLDLEFMLENCFSVLYDFIACTRWPDGK